MCHTMLVASYLVTYKCVSHRPADVVHCFQNETQDETQNNYYSHPEWWYAIHTTKHTSRSMCVQDADSVDFEAEDLAAVIATTSVITTATTTAARISINIIMLDCTYTHLVVIYIGCPPRCS